MSESAKPVALSRVAAIAAELEHGNPNARRLVRDLFEAFAEVMDHYRAPKPVSVPVPRPGAYLVFDPGLGGWRVRQFTDGHWAKAESAEALHPTHWVGLPDPPEGSLVGVQGHPRGEPEQSGAAVSLFITRAQKAALREQGFVDEQIMEMKPEEAHRHLRLRA